MDMDIIIISTDNDAVLGLPVKDYSLIAITYICYANNIYVFRVSVSCGPSSLT